MGFARSAKRLGRLLVTVVVTELGLLGSVLAQPPVCPGTATLTVFVEKPSATPDVSVHLDGNLAADAATCAGTGRTWYDQTMMCTGSLCKSERILNLQPGTWVHRVRVTVPGSATQEQAKRVVLVAGSPIDVSNAVSWTI